MTRIVIGSHAPDWRAGATWAVVNLAQVDRVDRDVLGRMNVQLKGHATTLPVSQSFQARFKAM